MSDPHRQPFIPSWLDDHGLTPAQFRVFCRISRRGCCTESLRNMAKGCRLRRRTVQDSLNTLCLLGMITRQKRFGRTDVLELAPIPFGVLGGKATDPLSGTTTQPLSGTSHRSPLGNYKGSPPKVLPGKVQSPGEAAQSGERETPMWQLRKDRESLIRQIRELKDAGRPDPELLSGLQAQLKEINDAYRAYGRKHKGTNEDIGGKKSRNAGTYNEGTEHDYDNAVKRVNPRNAAMGIDAAEQGRKLAEHLAKKKADKPQPEPAEPRHPDAPPEFNEEQRRREAEEFKRQALAAIEHPE